MAISSGVGPHSCWLSVNGAMLPIERGHCEQARTRKSASFSADIPLNWPGALATLANAGGQTASVIVFSLAGLGTLITGQLDTVDADFIGATKITVEGRDQSAALHETKSAEKFTNQTGSQIVQTLASRVGLQVQADSSQLMAGKLVNIDWAKLTDGISLAAVIQKVAELDGATWWVDKQGVLHYSTQPPQNGTYTISYDPGPPIVSDAHQLAVRANLQAGKNINVTVKSWHPKKKQVFTGQANVSGRGGQANYVYHIPSLDQQHAQQYAQSKANAHARHAFTLSAQLVGDPSIDIDMNLVLSGTGYFDGTYAMDSIHHDFGMRGYTMDIEAKMGNTAS